MRASTAKPIAALVLTGIGSALVVGFQVPQAATAPPTTTRSDAAAAATASETTGTTPAPTATMGTTATGTAAPSASTSTSTTAAVAAATRYADGTWTGTAVTEPWGTFQVQAVVSGGRLTDVVLVEAPQDGHSSRINDQAVPVLTRAAVAAQDASVDMVSGATWTSRSYVTSLQGAPDRARAAAESAA